MASPLPISFAAREYNHLTVKQHVARSFSVGSFWSTRGNALGHGASCISAPLGLLLWSTKPMNVTRQVRSLSTRDSNEVATDSISTESERDETENIQAEVIVRDETVSQMQGADVVGLQTDSEAKRDKVSSSSVPDLPKRSPLTAREKLRAARVLTRYTESKPLKRELGSNVLDALRESDRGKARGLPEAPTNLFDDSRRGMPKQGLTFDFPGGFDLFIIIFSFVFISSVMFATTYIVWKAGAIHFNEL